MGHNIFPMRNKKIYHKGQLKKKISAKRFRKNFSKENYRFTLMVFDWFRAGLPFQYVSEHQRCDDGSITFDYKFGCFDTQFTPGDFFIGHCS